MRGNGQAHRTAEGGPRDGGQLGPSTSVGIMRAARELSLCATTSKPEPTLTSGPTALLAASGWEARLREPTRPSLIHPPTHPIHPSICPSIHPSFRKHLLSAHYILGPQQTTGEATVTR